MFDKIKDSIKKFAGLSLVSKEEVEALIKDIQRDLLRADVEVEVLFELTKRIKKNSLEKEKKEALTLKEHVLKVVYDELVSILGEAPDTDLNEKIILLLGLYGSGKTTTAGKLANYYSKRGLKVGLIPCDIHRPAAFEQLKSLSEKTKSEFYNKKGKNASEIAKEGIKELKKKKCKIIIVDTAGRDALDKELLKEIKSIEKEAKAKEKILVLSSDIGQEAGNLSKKFSEEVGINGVIITKADNSSKGGGAITSCFHSGSKVLFIGKGEKITDFEIYDPISYVSEILGIPNLKGLLDKAKESFDEEKAKRMMSGEFSLEDFYDQMKTAKSSGLFSQVGTMFQAKLPKNFEKQMNLDIDVDKFKFMMDSMTKEEKENPEIINSSRIKRIARGSGTKEEDVRSLIRSYRQAKNLMSKFSMKSLKRGPLKSLLKGFKV